MKKIRAALVGLGRIGWYYHLPQLTSNENFELIAVVDPVSERLSEVSEAGIKCALYEDHDQMLAKEKPDLVVVASPTIFHEKQIISAFHSGADVFAEKPLTGTPEECDNILREMAETGRKLLVYQPRRQNADALCAAKIISSGILGKVHHIRRNVRSYNRRSDWQSLRRFGGGMLNNYGVHFVDQVCSVTGFDYKCEYCDLKRINSLGDAEDFVRIILRRPSGATAEVEISQSCSLPVDQWHIEGEFGTAYYTSETGSWQVRYADPAKLQDLELQDGMAATGRLYSTETIQWQEDFDLTVPEGISFYDNLVEYLLHDGEPLVKTSEVRAILQLLADARKLNASGK